MFKSMLTASALLLGLTLTGVAEANGASHHSGRGHVVARSLHRGAHYYHGFNSHHWAYSVWDAHYCRYQYYDTTYQCFYYWDAARDCYCPVVP